MERKLENINVQCAECMRTAQRYEQVTHEELTKWCKDHEWDIDWGYDNLPMFVCFECREEMGML